jgi:hypothetical protein
MIIILRGRWCHTIVLNVHAPAEDKTDDVKEDFHMQRFNLIKTRRMRWAGYAARMGKKKRNA